VSGPEHADVVLVGGLVHTLDPSAPAASAVAIRAGLVEAVGDDAAVLERRGPGTRVVDLGGACVTPGLVDGHSHPIWGSEITVGIDFSACDDLGAVRGALAAAPDDEGGWIRGWGLDPNAFGDAPLAASSIEEAVAGRPALVTLSDGHGALASFEALRRAQVTGPRSFASTAHIVCDDGGAPTGLLLEEGAITIVERAFPPQPLATRIARVRAGLDAMAASGLTGAHVMDGDEPTLEVIAALDEAGELPLRLRVAPWVRPEDPDDRLGEVLAMQGRGGLLWGVHAAKFFLDGTIDGGTAWLREPDALGQSTGSYWREPDRYRRAVVRCAAAGVQTVTHAIGDAAVMYVLDTLASVDRGAVVHRVEHVETFPVDQLGRFRELNVAVGIQPITPAEYTLADQTDNWSRRVGPERAAVGFPARDLLDAGALVVLGSDWPIAPFDPRLTLAAAQLRRPARRPERAPVRPDQAITAAEALHGYTMAAAEAASESDCFGRVAAGYRADLTVFGADPLAVSAETVADVPVLATLVDGRFRHAAPEFAA
jgi:predicted amidohydrolase YtcJ